MAWLAKRIGHHADGPYYGVLALWALALSLVVYLPGLLRLPPVDRTEVIWAETSRDMVARDAWLDPRYGGEVHAFRPIGAFWAQGLAATFAGKENARDIRVYRVPSLIAVSLAVVALYLLSAPIIGGFAAFTAAALFAVAPLTVLVANLAIAEGLSLFTAVIAMMALLRIYVDDGDPNSIFVLLFWLAFSFGILINALLVPILVAATLIALAFMDRDFRWLLSVRPTKGVVPLFIISIWWLVVREGQDGTAFAGLSSREFWAALGGSQDMKLRAFPGTFLLALLLGFLPGTALLAPAAHSLWKDRDEKLSKFLIAWVLGYLAYLELFSSKPGTYMVQTMFPALALGVALVVRDRLEGAPPPKHHAIPWPILAGLFPVALFAAIYAVTGTAPTILAGVAIALVAVLFALSARDGRSGDLRRWAVSAPIALGAFAVTLLGAVFPSIDKLWPAQQLQRAVAAACPNPANANASVAALGFREPSGVFTLKLPHASQSADALFTANPQIAIVESRWLERYFVANAARGGGQNVGTPLGCVTALNVMRGCPMSFAIYQRDPALNCAAPAAGDECLTAENLPALKKACD